MCFGLVRTSDWFIDLVRLNICFDSTWAVLEQLDPVLPCEHYNKNTYPMRNHMIPKKATIRVQELQGRCHMVPWAPAVAELGLLQFLSGYGFLLSFHDP